jgi:hypothetical protein
MSNRFIITEYKKWSRFKNPDFNGVYEATELEEMTINAPAPTDAPASPLLYLKKDKQDADIIEVNLGAPGSHPAGNSGMIIEVSNTSDFKIIKSTFNLKYPDTTNATADIDQTANSLGYNVTAPYYFYTFKSTPDTQYYVRTYYTNTVGKGPASPTETIRSYKAGYNPDSTVPEEVQVDPDFLTASKAAFDRKQNWIPYKGKTSGNYIILYGQVGKDPLTADAEWQVALAKDAKDSNGAGVLKSVTELKNIMTQEGGFQDGSNTGTFYSQALGGKVFKLWICTDTDLIYLKEIDTSASATATGTAQLATGELSASGDYYTISKLSGENFADKGIFKVDSVTADGQTTFKGYLDSAKGLDEFVLMKYLSDGSKLEPKYNGPVYTVSPPKILAHAGSLYEAYVDLGGKRGSAGQFGTEEDIVKRVVDDIQPLELLILSIVWDNNLWLDTSKLTEGLKPLSNKFRMYEADKVAPADSTAAPKAPADSTAKPSLFGDMIKAGITAAQASGLWWFKDASEFSSFPNATPVYDEEAIATGDFDPFGEDIVEAFPSATKPSFLLDMLWELEDDDINKKEFAQKLRAKYAALLDEEKYPKKFFTINSITGKTIINTNDKKLYDKYFKSDSNHFFLSSIAQIYIDELEGYTATDEWND